MSKITFRADDNLVDRLEGFEASKSEVMRNALRHYLDAVERGTADPPSDGVTTSPSSSRSSTSSIDRLIDARIESIVDDRLDALLTDGPDRQTPAPDVSVNLSLSGVTATDTAVDTQPAPESGTNATADADEASAESGTRKTSGHETGATAPHASHTPHPCSQCGETVAADHVFCPNCGEKSAHTPVCECGDELGSDWSFCPNCGRRTPAADVLDST